MTNTPNHTPAPADNEATVAEALHRFTDLVDTIAAENLRQSSRRNWWQNISRTAIVVTVLMSVMGYVYLLGGLDFLKRGPSAGSVGVVTINGPILGSEAASASTVVPLIRAACDNEAIDTLVLRINSPGGSPGDADRIATAVDRCKTKGKPVVASIGSIGASAAYLIASHADRIVANRYALVGSIGTIISKLEFSEAATRLGAREVTYASGKDKDMLSGWRSETDGQRAVVQELVDELANTFMEDVRLQRGDRLDESREPLNTGRVWTAADALSLGLIDEVMPYESLMDSYEGKAVYHFDPKQTLADRLSLNAAVKTVVDSLRAEQATLQLR